MGFLKFLLLVSSLFRCAVQYDVQLNQRATETSICHLIIHFSPFVSSFASRSKLVLAVALPCHLPSRCALVGLIHYEHADNSVGPLVCATNCLYHQP